MRHLLTRMLRELSYALEPLGRIEPDLVSLENNPGFVQAAAPTDPVVVARMELVIGERTSAASLLHPVRDPRARRWSGSAAPRTARPGRSRAARPPSAPSSGSPTSRSTSPSGSSRCSCRPA